MAETRATVAPLAEHMESLVELLRKLVPEAFQKFDEDAIHKCRVTTRRIKAAIELLEPILDGAHRKPMDKLGRRLRRRLGPLRDLDVMLGRLDELKRVRSLAPAIEWLGQRLQDERDRMRRKSNRKLSPSKVLGRLEAWPELRQDIICAGESIEPLLAQSLHLQLDRFVEQADHRGGAGDPHQLRIAGKSLRYTLELAKAQRHKLPKNVLRSFKRMQDMLGLWHDYVVLARCAMEAGIEQDLALHDPVMQLRVLELASRATKRAQKQLDRFDKLWKENGTELTQSIRDHFPLTTPLLATTPQTGPDPAGTASPPAAVAASSTLPPIA